jgi:hypothetical protein
MVTLRVENGMWFDLTLFGPRTAARCAGRTFGPTAPASSLCHGFCRSHFISNLRQCLIQSPDEFLLNPLQSLSLAKNDSNTLHHIFQFLFFCHAGLL